MVETHFDYNRLIYLNQAIYNNTATKTEKDEYMHALYNSGNISKELYEKYLHDQISVQEYVLNAAVTIGGILIIGYLVEELLRA